MKEIGAKIVGNGGTEAQLQAIEAEANAMGRNIKPKDARVATSAANNGAAVLTRDEKLFNFLEAAKREVRTY